jgi:hypothetical protein
MPRLWFVCPLNRSGRRNPDVADRGRTHFSSLFCGFEKGTLPEATCEPPYRSGFPDGSRVPISGVQDGKAVRIEQSSSFSRDSLFHHRNGFEPR